MEKLCYLYVKFPGKDFFCYGRILKTDYPDWIERLQARGYVEFYTEKVVW